MLGLMLTHFFPFPKGLTATRSELGVWTLPGLKDDPPPTKHPLAQPGLKPGDGALHHLPPKSPQSLSLAVFKT